MRACVCVRVRACTRARVLNGVKWCEKHHWDGAGDVNNEVKSVAINGGTDSLRGPYAAVHCLSSAQA